MGLAYVHQMMYINSQMKKRDLESKIKKFGWRFLRHGGNHDTWTNGRDIEQIPRHREINEVLARKIIRTAKNNPEKGG
jgi:mRNA interferase HicA